MTCVGAAAQVELDGHAPGAVDRLPAAGGVDQRRRPRAGRNEHRPGRDAGPVSELDAPHLPLLDPGRGGGSDADLGSTTDGQALVRRGGPGGRDRVAGRQAARREARDQRWLRRGNRIGVHELRAKVGCQGIEVRHLAA